MSVRYHKILASLRGIFKVLRNLHYVFRKTPFSDFEPSLFILLYYRMGKYDHWDKIATERECGCRAYKTHITSYLSNCEEHGLSSLFKDFGIEVPEEGN